MTDRDISPSLMALMMAQPQQPARPSIQEALLAMAAEEQAIAPPMERPARRDRKPLALSLGAMAAGQIADLVSTHQGLKRPNTVEANSFLYGERPSLGRLMAVKAGALVPTALMLSKVYEKNPKMAQAIAYGLGGLGAVLAAKNSQVGK